MLALPRRVICSSESQKGKKLLTSAISNAWKIHNAIKVCNIKGPKVVYKSACIVTMVAFVIKKFFVSTSVSFKSAFVFTLVPFEQKSFL